MMDQEKRNNLRYSYIETVTILHIENRAVIVKSENLSLGGVYLITDKVLPIGTQGQVILIVNKEDKKTCISAKFRVAHNQKSQEGFSGMGVAFTEIPRPEKKVLEDLIAFLKVK